MVAADFVRVFNYIIYLRSAHTALPVQNETKTCLPRAARAAMRINSSRLRKIVRRTCLNYETPASRQVLTKLRQLVKASAITVVAVVKWLRQWIVIPSCAGSNPVSHPILT